MNRTLQLKRRVTKENLPAIPKLLVSPEGPDCIFLIDLGEGIPEPVLGHFDENRAEDMFRRINAVRIRLGLPSLKQLRRYQNFSAVRALEASYFFEHERPNGIPFSQGENLAMCRGISSNRSVCEGWCGSPDHFANITAPEYRYTGISCFLWKEHRGEYLEYWAQIFG